VLDLIPCITVGTV